MSNLGTCRSCLARITWAVTTRTGRPIPLDVEPCVDGNVSIVGRTAIGNPLAHVFTKADLAQMREHGEPLLYRSHFASCPHADQHRRRALRTKEEH